MSGSLNHADVIKKEGLFWALIPQELVSDSKTLQELFDLEVLDWVSSLYWGETTSVEYAKKMIALASKQADGKKEDWEQLYQDELEHQAMLGSWFLEKELKPLPPTKLLQVAKDAVDNLDIDSDPNAIAKTIQRTQLFFESLAMILLNWRIHYVVDRDLKAILYKILQDESKHIALGRQAVASLSNLSSPKKEFNMKLRSLFPIHLAENKLPPETISSIKELAPNIVEKVLLKEKERSPYRPIEILQRWRKIPGYNCVACSPHRHDGLHLEPKAIPDSDVVFDEITFPKRMEGFPGLVHGGYITMALDEMMGYAGILHHQKLALTSQMNIQFMRPVRLKALYRIEAQVVHQKDNIFKISSKLIGISDQKTCAFAEGTFVSPNLETARRILGSAVDEGELGEMFWNS